MIRHISIFFVKEEQKERTEELLGKVKKYTAQTGAAAWTAGTDCMERPKEKFPGIPAFGDFVQIIDFIDEEEAVAYPHHPVHRKLMEEISYAVDKVVAIDVECYERCQG